MQGTLLIVDDEPLLVDSLQFLLRHVCEKILVAQNGEEAMQIMTQEKVDCVLSDYSMPVMCGMELLKAVRKTHATLPFIFYTGHGIESISVDLSLYSDYEVVPKPSFDKIPEAIRSSISRTYSSR